MCSNFCVRLPGQNRRQGTTDGLGVVKCSHVTNMEETYALLTSGRLGEQEQGMTSQKDRIQ